VNLTCPAAQTLLIRTSEAMGRPTVASTHPADFTSNAAADALGAADAGPKRPVAHHRLVVAAAGARDYHVLLGMLARSPDAGESVDGIAELLNDDLDVHVVLKTPHPPVEASDTGLGSLAGARQRMAEVDEPARLVAIELVRPARVELVAAGFAAVVPERRHQKHRSLAASYSATRDLASLKLMNLGPAAGSISRKRHIAPTAIAAANPTSSRSVALSPPHVPM